ncbi:hypothetical protein ACHAWO_002448 [Cyclotella atomus]|uniref:Uncharacterized protein n=1 Tax=Cyclotella atomus TaxID=382360 RepID=A0ABD3QNX4_9STRA
MAEPPHSQVLTSQRPPSPTELSYTQLVKLTPSDHNRGGFRPGEGSVGSVQRNRNPLPAATPVNASRTNLPSSMSNGIGRNSVDPALAAAVSRVGMQHTVSRTADEQQRNRKSQALNLLLNICSRRLLDERNELIVENTNQMRRDDKLIQLHRVQQLGNENDELKQIYHELKMIAMKRKRAQEAKLIASRIRKCQGWIVR